VYFDQSILHWKLSREAELRLGFRNSMLAAGTGNRNVKCRRLTVRTKLKRDLNLMSLPRIPLTLVDAVRRNDCVLFVGAGLSQGAGLPGWVGLLNRILSWYDENGVRLADLADIQRLIEEKDLLPAAEAIKDGVNPEIFRRTLSSIMDDESISPSPTHLLLPTIPFAAVLTSNYDRLLERAYGKVAHLPWVITHSSGTALTAALHERRFYILKVHGTIEHVETIVLGRRSYRELMHGNEAYVEHIRTLLRTKTLLFVGFSLSDPAEGMGTQLRNPDTALRAFERVSPGGRRVLEGTGPTGCRVRRGRDNASFALRGQRRRATYGWRVSAGQ
jgi:SIR2-like domain